MSAIRTILAAKLVRTTVYSALAIILGEYLVSRGLTSFEAGGVFSAAVAGNTVGTLGVPSLFGRLGLRRTSVVLPLLVALSGLLLLFSGSFVGFLVAAFVGSVSVAQTEAGGFVVVDQTIIPSFTGGSGLTRAFSTYNFVGYLGSSLGGAATLIAGVALPAHYAFRLLIAVYALSGFLLSVLYYSLPTRALEKSFASSTDAWSVAKTNREIATLGSLFSVDAFGGGLVAQSWVSYWFSLEYSLRLSTLGAIFLVANVLSALSLTLAPPLVRRLGLVRVMVFTHLPSNILLMLVPFAGSAFGSALIFFGRQTLSQLDVPTRQALVVSLVSEKDRAGALSLTTAVRGVAQTASVPLTGKLLSLALGSTPFLMAGGLKAAYDLAVFYTMRRRLSLGREEVDEG